MNTSNIARRAVALAALSIAASAAIAGGSVSQQPVGYLYGMDTGLVYIKFTSSVTITSKPSCSTESRWAINLATDAGRAQAAVASAAMAAGKKVSVTGKGTCTLQSSSEDLSYITVYR